MTTPQKATDFARLFPFLPGTNERTKVVIPERNTLLRRVSRYGDVTLYSVERIIHGNQRGKLIPVLTFHGERITLHAMPRTRKLRALIERYSPLEVHSVDGVWEVTDSRNGQSARYIPGMFTTPVQGWQRWRALLARS